MKNVIEELEASLGSLPQEAEDTVIREGIPVNEAKKWQRAVLAEDKYATSFRVKMTLGSEAVFLRLNINRLDIFYASGLVMLKEDLGEERAEMIYGIFQKMAGPEREKTRAWVAKDLSKYGGGRYLWRRLSWEGETWLEKDRIQRQPILMRAYEFAQAFRILSHDLLRVEPAESTI